MCQDYGIFPFGRSNKIRGMRPATVGRARVLVVGVYPSAFHVRWWAPGNDDPRRPTIGSMAVDVEPEVFWTGDPTPQAAQDRIAAWRNDVKAATGIDPDTLGKFGPGTNGTSGRTVQERYLDCLGVSPAQTAFTDVYQAFLLKRGKAQRRPGGTAIDDDYTPVAAEAGWPSVSIATRPSEETLISWAIEQFGDRIQTDLANADPSETVISLGNEALGALLRLLGPDADAAGETLQDIYDGDLYGTAGTLTVNGRAVEWFPLVHPGLLKGDRDPAGAKRKWQQAHHEWCHKMRTRTARRTPD